jgi:aspartyl-tRNA(Asn)/glutamyl-tRNA(Gln) amidotransferase subunit A
LAGICALSLPCGFDTNGLPIGLQVIGPAFGEELILQVAYAYEQSTDWQACKPGL